MLQEMKVDDYLLVQMGHNDSTISRQERYTEPYTTYKQYLQLFIDGARKKQSVPILITPVARLHVEDGQFINDFPDYCRAMKELAEENSVQLIDLNTFSLEYYRSIGYEASKKLFMISVNGTDCTHFTEAGAKITAEIVATELTKSLSLCK